MNKKEIVEQLGNSLQVLTQKRQELAGEGHLDSSTLLELVNAERKVAEVLARLQEEQLESEVVASPTKGKPLLCPSHEEELIKQLQEAYVGSFQCPKCVEKRNAVKEGKHNAS